MNEQRACQASRLSFGEIEMLARQNAFDVEAWQA
jgi:hypothetical protein